MIEAISYSDHIGDGPPAAASAQGLVDRAKLALIAVERTHMSMVVTDPNQPDNPIILANKSFLTMSGYDADEIIGRNCRFMQGPETSQASLEIIRDAVSRQIETTCELLNYRKDGSAFWSQLHISPIHDDRGRLCYYFGSQIDVTGRRRALELERAEHALLKEIDHRAKNALALVQGIVRLSRSDDPKQYAAAVQGRVQALATAHTLLAVGNWQKIPLDVLLRSQLLASNCSRVELVGPDIAVEVPQVQPVALVLHEIVTNAVRHGALSSPAGSMEICWRKAPDEVAIEFREMGGPPSPPPLLKGFGLSMAEAIVARQLNGELRLDWLPSGLQSRLTIPTGAIA